jgi:hypothetical protein
VNVSDLDRVLTILGIAICLVDMFLVIAIYRQRSQRPAPLSRAALAFRGAKKKVALHVHSKH